VHLPEEVDTRSSWVATRSRIGRWFGSGRGRRSSRFLPRRSARQNIGEKRSVSAAAAGSRRRLHLAATTGARVRRYGGCGTGRRDVRVAPLSSSSEPEARGSRFLDFRYHPQTVGPFFFVPLGGHRGREFAVEKGNRKWEEGSSSGRGLLDDECWGGARGGRFFLPSSATYTQWFRRGSFFGYGFMYFNRRFVRSTP